MTTIFAFPIKNAWILASDKLETDQTDIERAQTGNDTHPVSVDTKIKQTGNFIYAMSGSSQDILKIEQALSSCATDTIDYTSFKATIIELYGPQIAELDVEAIIIDLKEVKAYRFCLSNLPSSLQETQIFHIEKGIIGSGADRSSAKYHVISCLASYQDIAIQKGDSNLVRVLLGKSVECLEIMGRNDFQFTGHPAVYGCDICILTKSKAMKFRILPRRYKCKEETQTEWSPIEEWKDV